MLFMRYASREKYAGTAGGGRVRVGQTQSVKMASRMTIQIGTPRSQRPIARMGSPFNLLPMSRQKLGPPEKVPLRRSSRQRICEEPRRHPSGALRQSPTGWRQSAATTVNSTFSDGAASAAWLVARAGGLAGSIQASQTAFISAKVEMSER